MLSFAKEGSGENREDFVPHDSARIQLFGKKRQWDVRWILCATQTKQRALSGGGKRWGVLMSQEGDDACESNQVRFWEIQWNKHLWKIGFLSVAPKKTLTLNYSRPSFVESERWKTNLCGKLYQKIGADSRCTNCRAAHRWGAKCHEFKTVWWPPPCFHSHRIHVAYAYIIYMGIPETGKLTVSQPESFMVKFGDFVLCGEDGL